MSLTFQHFFTKPSSRITLYFTTHPPLKTPNLSPPIPFLYLNASLHPLNFQPPNPKTPFNFTLKPHSFPLKAYQLDDTMPTPSSGTFNLDDFLSVAEVLCIVSSAIVTIGYAVNCTVLSPKRTVLGVMGSSRVLAWGAVVMVCGMVIGAWIRRRQWWRICGDTVVSEGKGRESVNLVGRIEKLEEDVRSSATIIRVLSRQLEKLGIRFRVTRKSLKEPIAETAALAQKNSEATRALAVQEDMLEKELGEIQKVLLAMQEQQQKQLELILAIGKSGKLWENKREPNQEKDTIETSDLIEGVKQLETHETQASGTRKGNSNDRPQGF